MKKKILTLQFLIAVNFISLAQIKVTSQGNLGVGTFNPVSKLEVLGNSTSEIRLWATPLNQINNAGTARVWAINNYYAYGIGVDGQGKGHIYANVNSPNFYVTFDYSNTILGNSTTNGNLLPFFANGGRLGLSTLPWFETSSTIVRTNLTTTLSDERYKTNIKDLKGLETIKKIRGVSYDLRYDKYSNINEEEHNYYFKNNYGFIAQELEKITPNLVHRLNDSLGTYTVNYIGIIPLLVESVKELDFIIENLNTEISLLKQEVKTLKNKCIESEFSKQDFKAKLFQNKPNPFNVETTINYEIKGEYNSAWIYLYNFQGSLINKYLLQKNSNSINVSSNNLRPGVYYYSLYIDEIEIDTKKMIITE